MYLKQSTASQIRTIGPFVDDTDFKTVKNSLTIANTDILLKKNGGASAAKNSGGATADGSNGMYHLTFDATDTGTVGELAGSVKVSAALVVAFKFFVLEEAIYDALFAASAAAFDSNQDVTVGSYASGQAPLQPTVAGRTLDVSTGGEAGVDWANVGSQSTSVTLSSTTVGTATSVTSVASGGITATSIAADAIGASELAADAVTEIRSLASGTSDSGSTTTMVDAARTEADTDYWAGQLIVFTSGNISGQARLITAFNASTDTITFTPATTQAVSTQTYEIWPRGRVDVHQWQGSVPNVLSSGRVDATVGAMQADVVTASAIALDAIGASELAATAVNEIRDAILSDSTAFAGASIAAIKAKTDNLPEGVKKNTALNNFEFFMADSADHVTGKTGLTVTGTVSIDGAAFTALTNSVTEVANGIYKIDLAAADLNGTFLTLKFTATGADATLISLKTTL